jgi:hypothetical protein
MYDFPRTVYGETTAKGRRALTSQSTCTENNENRIKLYAPAVAVEKTISKELSLYCVVRVLHGMGGGGKKKRAHKKGKRVR